MSAYITQLKNVLDHPVNRTCRMQSLGRAFWWFLYKRIARRPVVRTIFGDRLISCHPDGLEAKTIMLFSEWCEYDTLKFMDEYLRPGDRYLDVGANVGRYVLLASKKVGARGEIIAVEPVTRNIAKLRENLRLNGLDDVQVLEFAVSDAPRQLKLTDLDSISTVVEDDDGETATVEAEARPLDELVPHQKYDLFKLDVEGYEMLALKGAAGLLAEGCFPVICFEHNTNFRLHGIAGEEVLDLLESAGYTLASFHYAQGELNTLEEPDEDVIAFNAEGERQILGRMRGIRIVR